MRPGVFRGPWRAVLRYAGSCLVFKYQFVASDPSMVNQMLASGAPIEVPFKNYFSFTSQNASMDQTTNFAVASRSIDRFAPSGAPVSSVPPLICGAAVATLFR